MSNLTAGIHTVSVVEHGLTSTQKGDPAVFIVFSNGAKWQGYLTEKAQEWTVKSLVTLGFKGNDLKELNYPGAIHPGHKVSITMENESYTNDKGENKTTLKVKWINPLPKKLSETESVKILGGMNLKGMFASERTVQGVEHSKTEKPEVNLQGSNISTEDIPF